MASRRIAFSLRVPWDKAAQALERAIAGGRTRFEVLDRGNGFWHLRAGKITVHIEMRIESASSTLIWAVGKHKGFRLPGNRRLDDLLRTLHEDVSAHLGGSRSVA